MCGIAGIINKQGMDVSSRLVEMLSLIQHRGPDASGISVYGDSSEVCLRVSITGKEMETELDGIVNRYASIQSKQRFDSSKRAVYYEFIVTINEADIPDLHLAINSVDGLYVHSLGKGMKVFKDGGPIDNLTRYQEIGHNRTTHGLGHVRMATESAEDVNAAHPFVSPFYPELSIVHNGQFTNYFNLRRSLQTQGAIFKTMNDSEAASHLIANTMKENGGDLEASLHYAGQKLDGIFCIIAATKNQIGFVKDKLGIKPLLLVEKDGLTLLGSEQIEFTAVFPDVFAEEIEPGEVRVWNI